MCIKTRRRNNTRYASVLWLRRLGGRCDINTKSIHRAISTLALDEQWIQIWVEIHTTVAIVGVKAIPLRSRCSSRFMILSILNAIFNPRTRVLSGGMVALTTLTLVFPYDYTETVEKTKKLNIKNNMHTRTWFTIVKRVTLIFRSFSFYWKNCS